MRTLTGTYANGVTLNGLSGDDPLTVASTGSISSFSGGIGLYCTDPFRQVRLYRDVTNYGRITAHIGVVIEDGGRLANGASGTTGAYIAGGDRAISMPHDGGAVVNYGTVAALAANSTAIYLSSGQVKNFGLIRGPDTEVEIGEAGGTVANYGTIGNYARA